jgi:probable phosphoglycerate mutase
MTSRRCVLVMRHGETDWNLAGRFQGHTDIPINATGVQQVERAAQWLAREPIAHVVSSDLSRARQSAEPAAGLLGTTVATDPALRERSYGLLEGLTWTEIEAQHPEIHRQLRSSPHHVPIPGGESPDELKARTWPAFWQVARRSTDTHAALLVSHGGVIRSWLLDVVGPERAPRPVPNATPYRFWVTWDAEQNKGQVTAVERMDGPGQFVAV